jgi:hypothetical protein
MRIVQRRQTDIVNAEISPLAGIEYSKLNLLGSIVNADIATAAAIQYSKLESSRLPMSRMPSGSNGHVLIASGAGNNPYYGYHDGLAVAGNCYSSTYVWNNSTERSSTSTSPVMKKRTYVDEYCISVNVRFDIKSATGSTVHGQIYVNGDSRGDLKSTALTTYTTYTQTFYDINAGDSIELWVDTVGSDCPVYVMNLRFGVTRAIGKFGGSKLITPLPLDQSLTITFTDSDPT